MKSLNNSTKIESASKDLTKEGSYKNLTNQRSEKQKITFSFRFFQQQKPYFGLSGQQNTWFVSLLNRLQDVSNKEIDFLLDKRETDCYRFHEINWKQKGIKIKRSDFYWVDKKYLDNEKEYEFFQFEISTGVGRVIGFFDESSTCFNIVALDPRHNLQPSKIHNWQTQKTYILDSEIEKLHSGLARYVANHNDLEEELYSILNFEDYEYCAIDSDFYQTFSDLCANGKVRGKFREFLLEESCRE